MPCKLFQHGTITLNHEKKHSKIIPFHSAFQTLADLAELEYRGNAKFWNDDSVSISTLLESNIDNVVKSVDSVSARTSRYLAGNCCFSSAQKAHCHSLKRECLLHDTEFPHSSGVRKCEPQLQSEHSTKRIRLHPNEQEEKIIKRWLGAVRWTYNQCIHWINTNSPKLPPTERRLRTHCVSQQALEESGATWALEVPQVVRDYGMTMALVAYDSSIEEIRENPEQFQLPYRKKKYSHDVMEVSARDWNKKKSFLTGHSYKIKLNLQEDEWVTVQGINLKVVSSEEPIPDIVDYSCEVTQNLAGHYFLCVKDRKVV